jgi:hypothetical protein
MYKLNFIAVVTIVAAVSLALGMASPAAFAAQHENMTMNMDDNISSVGNMTGGGNATSMAGNMTETESLPSAGETGYDPKTGCYFEEYSVLVGGMASPAIAAFAQQDNMTMNMDDNMSSMGNMTGGNATMTMDDNMTSMSDMSNATSMTGQ